MQVNWWLLLTTLASMATATHAIDFSFKFHDVSSNQEISNKTISKSVHNAEIRGAVIGSSVAVNASDYTITKACTAQNWTITSKSASSIQLHFLSIQLPPGDALVVVTQKGMQVPIVPATDGRDTMSTAVSGSAVTLEYRPSPSCTSSTATFTLDHLVVGTKSVKKEAICGTNDLKNAICFNKDKKMYQASKAVIRTRRVSDHYDDMPQGEITACTAWLWGNKGHILTNHHCFWRQGMVDNAYFSFGMELDKCGTTCDPFVCKSTDDLTGRYHVTYIQSDKTLDYAILQIKNPTKAAALIKKYGYLQMDFKVLKGTEPIYIPQHPGGTATKITMSNAELTKGSLNYAADTEHGSSGSPVISRITHHVIGLHHSGTKCSNSATPASSLRSVFEKYAKTNDGGVW